MIKETKNILLIKGFSVLTYLSGRDTTLTESKLIDRINLCFLQVVYDTFKTKCLKVNL